LRDDTYAVLIALALKATALPIDEGPGISCLKHIAIAEIGMASGNFDQDIVGAIGVRFVAPPSSS
jgi:hypothetical protein